VVRRDGLGRELQRADIAVVAGGVTLYEACAIGTPVVATAVVPAQRPAIAGFARAGAALDGGRIGTMPRASARQVATLVATLVKDEAARRGLAANGRRLVDGNGAARVARQIARLGAGVWRKGQHV
jgi:spore coat polysaccharide biosynthesis predicted glycosyltransferase SpsG